MDRSRTARRAGWRRTRRILAALMVAALAGLGGSGGRTASAAGGYTVTDLGTLGGTYSSANGINSAGQVVGYATTATRAAQHAFLYDGTTMRDLGTLPGGSHSLANGINAAGQVVGYSDTAGGAEHAFLYDGTTMQDLNTLIPSGSGWVLNQAYSINDNGQIAGVGTINGQYHAFLLTPMADSGGSGSGSDPGTGTATPELGSGELFATGLLPLGAVLLFRRRRRRAQQKREQQKREQPVA